MTSNIPLADTAGLLRLYRWLSGPGHVTAGERKLYRRVTDELVGRGLL